MRNYICRACYERGIRTEFRGPFFWLVKWRHDRHVRREHAERAAGLIA